MVETRVRSRAIGHTTGTEILYGSTSTRVRDNGVETVTDVSGNRDGINGFYLQRTKTTGGILSGLRWNRFEGTWASWTDYPMMVEPHSSASPVPFSYSEGGAALRAINITNPARHKVLAPAFILELRDLPKMWRLAGRWFKAADDIKEIVRKSAAIAAREDMHIPFGRGMTDEQVLRVIKARLHLDQQAGLSVAKFAATIDLTWQFGIAPVISDINKMIGFSESVARRRRELDRLFKGSGLKRTVNLQDVSKSYVQKDYSLHSVAGFMQADVRSTGRTRIWATTRFKPVGPSRLPPSDADIIRQMYGLTVHGVLASAWELLPWSWFIDYFTNIGDIVAYGNNELGCSVTCCVMMHQEHHARFSDQLSIWPGDGSKAISGYHKVSETMSRGIGLPDLSAFSASLPILGNGQLSVLASLSVLSRGRQ